MVKTRLSLPDVTDADPPFPLQNIHLVSVRTFYPITFLVLQRSRYPLVHPIDQSPPLLLSRSATAVCRRVVLRLTDDFPHVNIEAARGGTPSV